MKKLVMALIGTVLCLQLTGCSMPFGDSGAPNREESLESFEATMRASFYGEIDDYNDLVSGYTGQSLYESEVEQYAYGLMYWAAVEDEYLERETLDGFMEIAKENLAKVKWEVVDFYAVNADNGYDGIIEVYLYPTDLMDLMYDDVQDAIDAYNEIYEDYDYRQLEALYGQMILEIAQLHIDEAQAVSKPDNRVFWYDYSGSSFGTDGGIVISNTDWNEVDRLILDLDRLW